MTFCEHMQVSNMNVLTKNHAKMLSMSEDIEIINFKPVASLKR